MPANNTIFFCYDELDVDAVSVIYDRLVQNELPPWMESRDLLPGHNVRDISEKALRNAGFVLLFFSSKPVTNRGKIQRQFKQALDAVEDRVVTFI